MALRIKSNEYVTVYEPENVKKRCPIISLELSVDDAIDLANHFEDSPVGWATFRDELREAVQHIVKGADNGS